MPWTAWPGRGVESGKDLLCWAHEILLARLLAPLPPGAVKDQRELTAWLLLHQDT